MTMWREFEKGEVEAARELYMRFGPSADSQIVREMAELGFKKFRLKDLAARKDRMWPGLIRLHGWNEEYARMNGKAVEASADDAVDVQVWRTVIEPATEEEKKRRESAEKESERIREAADLMRRADGFPRWLAAAEPGFKWHWPFQKLIFRSLQRMTSGRRLRLMIFMPPRHGKSELVTIRYAAWRLLRDPKLRIVIASYNQKLANKFSRRVRRMYEELATDGKAELRRSAEMQARTPAVQSKANMVDEWETASGGGVKAVGVGAGITGFGADLIIIDEPIKGRADAESENNRERVWDWYTDDLHTRLEPKGAVILIQTRWHEDDLAGRLLNAERGMQNAEWEVIRLPALAEGDELAAKSREKGQKEDKNLSTNSGKAEPFRTSGRQAAEERTTENTETTEGEEQEGTSGRIAIPHSAFRTPHFKEWRRPGAALCPERFTREALLKIKEQMGSYKFDALYQQNPVPTANCLFKREWFSNTVDAAPAGLRWYRGYDLAVSTKTTADYTASFRVAHDKATGILYIADGMRARLEFPDQRKYIISRIREETDTEHGIEEALHGQGLVQDLLREASLSRFAFRGIKVKGDKLTRALSWANRAEAGKAVLVRGRWTEAFLDEVCRFPHGPHDDQIDAVSLAVNMMEFRKREVYAF